jgi:hypothetical protein
MASESTLVLVDGERWHAAIHAGTVLACRRDGDAGDAVLVPLPVQWHEWESLLAARRPIGEP